ncbi:hypothetical protein POM88_039194 [Heracleum sosnowskyi]|uniref:Uncharacterized protein n=1 Tax=Heracleum sosnowskyi TaxID=360622 RepID=A0AAD8M940_9APIA|nr:hypothetical protein POM88_039194 [Heracleum sosnowskyi]
MEEPLLETADNCLENRGGASVVVVDVETLSSSSLPRRWEVIVSEMKKVSYIAMPMVVTTVSQNLLRVISMMMIGHLGELSLSGASIATSLTNVTGFSLLGVARGVGWQRLGAYVNLGAYYLCGIPLACVLAFVLHWRGKGLWIGLTTASLLQGLMLMTITFFTDWKMQVRKARERIYERKSQITIE